jgi:hypothetical protein
MKDWKGNTEIECDESGFSGAQWASGMAWHGTVFMRQLINTRTENGTAKRFIKPNPVGDKRLMVNAESN